MIYLDEAATTKPHQEVIDAMMPYLTDMWFNPSSLYGNANKVKKVIEDARKTVGDFINANSNEIFFTSGGSESNCWAIQGFVNYWRRKNRHCTIITSKIEHKSILSVCEKIAAHVNYVKVDKDGFIDMVKLEEFLKSAHYMGNKILVSIQLANNEIGTIQYVDTIASLVHKYGGVFHTDAVQAFGHVIIDVKELNIDMLSGSGHKINAPKGVGFLYKKSSVEIDPIIYGSQMDGMRGGTENVAGIVGMAKAVELRPKINEYFAGIIGTQVYMMDKLESRFGCKINGSVHAFKRLPNNISVTFPQNITSESLIYMLDMCGIMASAGSACNSHSNEPSHVLKAIGLTDDEAMRTVRFTLPEDIDTEAVDKVMCELEKQIDFLLME